MRHYISFCKGYRSISVMYNYHRIVLYLHRTLHSFNVLKQYDLRVKLCWFCFFAAAALSSLSDPFLVPPTQTHAHSKAEHWHCLLQDSAGTHSIKICCFKICLTLKFEPPNALMQQVMCWSSAVRRAFISVQLGFCFPVSLLLSAVLRESSCLQLRLFKKKTVTTKDPWTSAQLMLVLWA